MGTTLITTTFLRRLSVAQRDELIAHVAGAQPFIIGKLGDGGRMATIRRLLELKLIKGDDPVRPRFTYLTDPGREAVAAVLGEYADALVAAGCLTPELRPIDLAAVIKAEAEQRKLLPPRAGKDYDRHYRHRRA